MRTSVRLLLLSTSALVLAGCSREAEPPPPVVTAPRPAPPTAAPVEAPVTARAILTGLNGSTVGGEVKFTATAAGVSIEAHVNGLTPGKHGFHIHEVGECAGDGTSAGPHFNPTAAAHGGPDGEVLHAGDMGNIEADATGHAMVTMISKHVSLEAGVPNSIIGRSVIVHQDPDDLTSQPAGNAGPRIACGIITLDAAAAPAEGAAPAEAAAPAEGAAPAEAAAPAPATASAP